jgi:ADP-ribosylglycohydrolase
LQSPDDYRQAIAIAIGIGGDTDTIAAMTGSIIGGRVGREALPPGWCERLTDHGSWKAAELETLMARAAASVGRERVAG